MAESNKIAVKAYLLYVMMVALMLVVVFRVIAIQYGDVVPNHHVIAVDGSDSITDHKERLDSISPLRGRILTDNGSVLVTSIPEYDLHMDLSVVKKDMFDEHVDSLAGGLAEIFVGHYTKKRWRELLAVAHTDKKQYFKILI